LPESDIDLLNRVAIKSGEIAMGFFQDDPEVWEKGDEAGPVTEADLAVNAYLQETLQTERPNYGWLSEETEDNADRLHTKRQFVIDPIDGTRAFIEGAKDWAHSIAIVENGVAVAGAVYLPIRDQMFAATKGGGATLNGSPITVSSTDLHDATMPVFGKMG